jgi:hypothetical protein
VQVIGRSQPIGRRMHFVAIPAWSGRDRGSVISFYRRGPAGTHARAWCIPQAVSTVNRRLTALCGNDERPEAVNT